ncbi:transcriptional regulator [Planctomycetota bacterium]|nr:transcriptional regulator [Planctomycetota bacterium]
MLRISKKADYAVFLLGCFAREGAFPGGSAATSVVSAHEVARLAGLNKSVVANLLKIFAKEGMLESVRGLNGGYRLTREPLQVTLGQILTAIDGPFQLVECVRDSHRLGSSLAGSSLKSSQGHQCSLISFCPSKNPMRVVHDRIERILNELTLSEMCGLTACPTTPLFALNTHR